MKEHEAVITKFYQCFQKKDAAGMADCYHPEATFSDPVFTDLKGKEVPAMWEMLVTRGKDLQVHFSDVNADGENGRATWIADYSFSKTGRKVHNEIEASFVFKDGKIFEHEDSFDLWAWTRMALGPVGIILGWTPMVQGKIRRESRAMLDSYMKKSGK
jgi:ketosteroid isomerase-like protein